MEFDNPFEAPGEWLRGNLHTHTTESDGVLSPQDRAAAYEARGYDFLALTDHGRVTEIDGIETRGLLLLRGTEVHAPMPTGGEQSHVLAVDLPRGFQPPQARHAQTLIDALLDVGAVVILAHPYWCGHTIKDFEVLDGYCGVEVFNTSCLRGIGRGASAVHWDDLLSQRRKLFGFAVDDVHKASLDAYGGWVVVKAASRTKDGVMNAIRRGRFYSTCGPTIEHLSFEDGVLRVRTSPVAYISFVCHAPKGGHVFREDGSLVTEAEFRPSDSALYVRVEATDQAGRTAWSNPIFLFDES